MPEQSSEARRSFYSYDFSQFHRDYYGDMREFGDYEFAYQFGYQLAHDHRFRGRSWDDINDEVIIEWQSHYPDFAWDQYSAAVSEGWRRVAGTPR